MCLTGQGGALKDSSYELSHHFPRRALPRKDCWSVALISLCQAWSSSHTRHTNDRQPEAYRTLNKRGRIPCVFPHEDTSWSRAAVGCRVSMGELAQNNTSSAEGLSALLVCFFLLSSFFNPSLPPTALPLSSVHPTSFGIDHFPMQL